MLHGREAPPAFVRALDTYLNTVSDHGLNASTFTARVIVSTGSDVVSAVTGAVGALKGPLHGGAPGPALDLLFEIRSAERAEAVLREKLARGERLMGFGHRVYRTRDPRADVLGAAAEHLFERAGNRQFYELAQAVEACALRLLREYKPARSVQTNVEFYTALLLHGIGFPTPLFTPIFAAGRVAGWTAHCLEQIASNRLFRPQSTYTGARHRKWTSASEQTRRSLLES
jgi:citrate synthase